MRSVMRWQALVSAVLALVAALWMGGHAGLSALLGGGISLLAGAIYTRLAAADKIASADAVLYRLLRAEAIKILIMITGLWSAFALYEQVVAVWMIGVFIIATGVFSIAVFVPEPSKK